MKLISVIMPAYNAEKSIKESVESVLNQTYKNIELLIIDDGSEDYTNEIVQKFLKQDDRIKYFRISNSGSAVARNLGLEKCTGDYISFVDSDDQIHPEMLNLLLKKAETFRTDIISCSYKNVFKDKMLDEKTFLRKGFYNKDDLKKIIYPNLFSTDNLSDILPLSMWTKLFRRELIFNNNLKFVPELRMSQDKIFTINCFLLADTFYYLPDKKFYYYYYNLDSRTHTYLNDSWKILKSNYYELKRISQKFPYNLGKQLPYALLRNSMTAISNVSRSNKNYRDQLDELRTIVFDYDLQKSISIININKLSFKRRLVTKLIQYKLLNIIWILSKLFNKIKEVTL
ncbi:glycosyltransferase family 2 protein [Facklamia sp. P13055]|uniref:glycosyltransferase family 2 protein n=1 Tax=Facklamia sp. P13055 TaxID=3421952 RepID=UPI003D183998